MSTISAGLPSEMQAVLFCLILFVLVPLMIWAVFDLERRKNLWQLRRHARRLPRRGSPNI
jgi:hypothetical protein